MDKISKLTFCFVLLFFSVACSTTEYRRNIPLNYTFNENNGVIVGSVTLTTLGRYPDTAITGNPYFNTYFDIFSLQPLNHIATLSNIRPVNVGASVLVSSFTIFLGRVGTVHDKSQFSNQHGQVFALELPPGHYTIMRWKVGTPGKARRNTSSGTNYTPPEFEVKKGEITYIGNINMDVKKWTENIWGWYLFDELKVDIEDRSNRDIPLLLNKFQNLKTIDIKHRILQQQKAF